MLSLLGSLAALLPSPRPGSGLAPRVVFTDCDGTMLRPDHTLSPAATAMLHTLHSRGVRVVPSTGRARAGPWTETVLAAHPVLQRGSPGVYINGCSAFTEDGEALASTYLPDAVRCAMHTPCTRRAHAVHTPSSTAHRLRQRLARIQTLSPTPKVAERVLRWWRTSPEAAGCGLVAYVGGEAMHI